MWTSNSSLRFSSFGSTGTRCLLTKLPATWSTPAPSGGGLLDYKVYNDCKSSLLFDGWSFTFYSGLFSEPLTAGMTEIFRFYIHWCVHICIYMLRKKFKWKNLLNAFIFPVIVSTNYQFNFVVFILSFNFHVYQNRWGSGHSATQWCSANIQRPGLTGPQRGAELPLYVTIKCWNMNIMWTKCSYSWSIRRVVFLSETLFLQRVSCVLPSVAENHKGGRHFSCRSFNISLPLYQTTLSYDWARLD